MCGRYAFSARPEDLAAHFDVPHVQVTERLEPDYNVAPTKEVYAVVERPPKGEETPERQLRVLRWGLVPSWAENPSIASRLINARAETVADKPAFRRALESRRCLLPADGYFEWYGPRKAKQPYFIRPRGGGVLAMAGLYEMWCDQSRPKGDPARWLWTCTILTSAAEESLRRLHDRMPVFLEPHQYDEWLDPRRRDPRKLGHLLQTPRPGRLEAYPVSDAVSNVRNNGPDLIAPSTDLLRDPEDFVHP